MNVDGRIGGDSDLSPRGYKVNHITSTLLLLVWYVLVNVSMN